MSGPLLAYYGHHKSGSTWILYIVMEVCNLVSMKMKSHHSDEFFDGDIEEYRRNNPFDFWCYINADYTFVRYLDTRGFHVVRDPRDVIISGYFSHLSSHPVEHWPRLKFYRRYLRTLSKEEGLMLEIEFSSSFLHHMLSWDYDTPQILQLRFEDLLRGQCDRFIEIFRFLGLVPDKISEQSVCEIVERCSFEKLSGGRKAGTEDVSHHYRRGVPGDWRNHFTGRHIEYFKKLYNPVLMKLGYETGEDW